MTLLQELEDWLSKSSLAESTLGYKCCRNPRLLRNLREGKELMPSTTKKIKEWLKSHNPHYINGRTERAI